MAFVLPLLLAQAMGILVYGQDFGLAHRVRQAANDGARAAIVGLDAGDRSAITAYAVDRSLQGLARFSPDTRTIAVSETAEAVTADVSVMIPADNFL